MSDEDSARRQQYLVALIAEIRILVRSLAGDPKKRLSDVAVDWSDGAGGRRTYTYADIVHTLANIHDDDEHDLLLRIGLLQAFRDQLTRMTDPASGVSIAYTALVSGEPRSGSTETMSHLALVAYGALDAGARWHRRTITALCVFVLGIALLAAWEATRVSVGKNLLQVLEPLRAQQIAVAKDKHSLESRAEQRVVVLQGSSPPPPGKGAASGAKGAAAPPDAIVSELPLCQRHLRLEERLQKQDAAWIATHQVTLQQDTETRELCERDQILASSFLLAHANIDQYLVDWTRIAGGPYAVFGDGMRHIAETLHWRADQDYGWWKTAVQRFQGELKLNGDSRNLTGDDIEFFAAPLIQSISSFVLPFIFGVIGSILYVVLDHYGKIKTSTLLPRDRQLALIRVTLGITVAACLSLLITEYSGPSAPLQLNPTGSSAPGTLVGSLSLSASLITFLAGFGAEAVFTLLQTLVERVFAAPK